MQIHEDGAACRIKTVPRRGISGLFDNLPGDRLIVDICPGGDFSENMNLIRRTGHFAGHPGIRILFQETIQNAVGDPVADFIRMAARHDSEVKKSFNADAPQAFFFILPV